MNVFVTAVVSVFAAAGLQAVPTLEEGFANPPDSAKPHTWYHMMNGNVTKEGITCDFEALARVGIGGVQMFDAGCDIPPGPLKFNSDEWFDMFRHAQKEAKRLGLEICIPNCSGWSSSGGPWNPPANAMKVVVFTETPAKGPSSFSGKLPRTSDDHGFYDDIAVLAYPTPKSGAKLDRLDNKTFRERGDTWHVSPEFPKDQLVARGSEVDLTSRMAKDGSFEWDVPEGDWTILRIGYICNGRCNHPASEKGRGLEVDKLSASAMDYHFDQYVTRLCRDLGITAQTDNSTGFNNILVDSYEVGCQNWTQGLDAEFERRMGYSPCPYLPVFAGRVVGSADESERFLEDFRRVVADLFAENYAGRLTKLCHDHGLMCSIEPYGNCTSDDLQYGQDVDVPMAEFWSNAALGAHGSGDVGNSRHAAHIAHVWGRRYAATESFTADPGYGGRWRTTPFSIKSQGDKVFAAGINRIIYHRFTHQPWPGNAYLPGMTMGRWGMHLDRTQTWWELSPLWFRYQARCQWMLQEGVFAADALYWTGEEVPNGGGMPVPMPAGYSYDVCATKAVEMLTVKNGKVVAPGGVEYSILILPETDTMSERMVRRVGELLSQGAKICGRRRPTRAPGLRGYPAADASVRKLAAEVWSRGVMECNPADAFAKLGVKPDFAGNGLSWIHRRSAASAKGDKAEWYFVAMDNEEPATVEASFRQQGLEPEIWDAETGAIRPARVWREEDGRSVVRLEFKPSGSAFIVFRKPAKGPHLVAVKASVSPNPEPATGEKEVHTLVVKKAEYGTAAKDIRPKCVDVSPFIKPGKPVRIDNALAGDPAQGKVKTTEITYAEGGKSITKTIGEGATFTLPEGAELVGAWYGLPEPGWKKPESPAADITAKLNALVKDGYLSVVVNNAFVGHDPVPDVRKRTKVVYEYDGRESTVEVGEGTRIVIPAPVEKAQPPPEWEWKGDGGVLAWQPLEIELSASDGSKRTLSAKPAAPVAVEGEWKVSFPSGWDAPESIVFPKLTAWDRHENDGVKYFSGTATYRKNVELKIENGKLKDGERVMLDLGVVKDFAEVKVNGKSYPVLWKPPFRVDVTDALKEGDASFELEVKVTNLWANRLIGDDRLYADDCEWSGASHAGKKEIAIREIPQWVKEGRKSPTGRHTFTTWKHWSKEDDLLPSGLIGPVVLRFGEPATCRSTAE